MSFHILKLLALRLRFLETTIIINYKLKSKQYPKKKKEKKAIKKAQNLCMSMCGKSIVYQQENKWIIPNYKSSSTFYTRASMRLLKNANVVGDWHVVMSLNKHQTGHFFIHHMLDTRLIYRLLFFFLRFSSQGSKHCNWISFRPKFQLPCVNKYINSLKSCQKIPTLSKYTTIPVLQQYVSE